MVNLQACLCSSEVCIWWRVTAQFKPTVSLKVAEGLLVNLMDCDLSLPPNDYARLRSCSLVLSVLAVVQF